MGNLEPPPAFRAQPLVALGDPVERRSSTSEGSLQSERSSGADTDASAPSLRSSMSLSSTRAFNEPPSPVSVDTPSSQAGARVPEGAGVASSGEEGNRSVRSLWGSVQAHRSSFNSGEGSAARRLSQLLHTRSSIDMAMPPPSGRPSVTRQQSTVRRQFSTSSGDLHSSRGAGKLSARRLAKKNAQRLVVSEEMEAAIRREVDREMQERKRRAVRDQGGGRLAALGAWSPMRFTGAARQVEAGGDSALDMLVDKCIEKICEDFTVSGACPTIGP
jgi:hypothetical protein